MCHSLRRVCPPARRGRPAADGGKQHLVTWHAFGAESSPTRDGCGGSLGVVPACAPRIPDRLVEALVRLDDPSVSIAETNRRLGEQADRLGLTRPSYERVRELVHESRRIRRGPSTGRVLWEVAVRARAPEEF